jgi:hypothetical protein
VEETPPANEARPHEDETAQGPEREKCPNASENRYSKREREQSPVS